MSLLQAMRVVAVAGGFALVALVVYRLLSNQRFIPRGQKIMYCGLVLWVYSYTWLTVDRLNHHAEFNFNYWVGNVGTFTILYGLLYRFQPPQNIGLEPNRMKSDRELFDAYHGLLGAVQEARAKAEED